jgi:lysophospholipase L1-like esterase
VVILALGANDGLRGLPVAAMKDNLQAMARQARQSGARVLLVGMRLPPNYGPQYTRISTRRFATWRARKSRAAALPARTHRARTRRLPGRRPASGRRRASQNCWTMSGRR